MKVIHVMTKNVNSNFDFTMGNTTKLVAFLSVLKWKSFGYTTKIYVDEYFKEYFDKIGLLDLYDEVDDTYFTENDLYAQYKIDKYYFWAFSKLFVYLNETEPFILSDMDFIPLQDFHSIIKEDENYVYYNEILQNNKSIYPDKESLPTAGRYAFPKWLTWSCLPVNTAIVYLSDKSLIDLYITESIRYAKNNKEKYTIEDDTLRTNEVIPRMVFSEQRLLPECANYLNIKLNKIKSNYELVFNPREIHLFIYKNVDSNDNKPYNWLLFFFDKLNQEFPETYAKLINLEEFSEIKEKIDSEGFVYETPKMLKRTNW